MFFEGSQPLCKDILWILCPLFLVESTYYGLAAHDKCPKVCNQGSVCHNNHLFSYWSETSNNIAVPSLSRKNCCPKIVPQHYYKMRRHILFPFKITIVLHESADLTHNFLKRLLLVFKGAFFFYEITNTPSYECLMLECGRTQFRFCHELTESIQ